MNWYSMALTAVIVVLLGASAWQGWRLYQGMPGLGVDGAATAVESQANAQGKAELAAEPYAQTPTVTPEQGSGPDAPTLAAPVEEDEVARLLAAAEADLEARRLTSPQGNNAWEKYRRVLGLSSAHPEAIAGWSG